MTTTAPPPSAAAEELADAVASTATLRRFLHGLPGVDQVGVEARAATLATRSIKTTAKAFALDLAIRMIDLTTLEGQDTPGKVRALCAKGRRPDPNDPSCPPVAAICVYGDLVETAVEALAGSEVKVAAVATAFPSGRAPLDVKLEDVRAAVDAGADEIDMVIDRGAFLAGRYLDVYDEIVATREACGDAHLKVILETGELATYDNVRRASWLAMLAGGDVIKTSTGKVSPAATLPVTLVMLEAVRDFRSQTGRLVGVKAAGGIRSAKDAVRYLVLVNETCGDDWLTPRCLPLRGVVVAQRPAHAAPEARHRPVRRPRLLHPRLMPAFEYAPAPESASIVDIAPSYGLFIDGEMVDPIDGSRFKTINPATEEVLSEVAAAGPQDVDRAVAAARAAYEGTWSTMPGRERGKYLFRLARLVQERSRELAVLESIDNGKPIRESRDVDLPLVAAHFFYHAGWADKLGYAGLGPDPRPLGVAAQVIPWNFPLLMLAWKIAPALATGNTVVLKPAETTPLTALAFADICRQADLPPGVVNIVTGAGDTGRTLVEHPGVDKVAFTGSTEVGRQIAMSVAGTRKKVTLELGGKAANVVFDDAPLDQAVEGIVNGIFFNQGHVCCAGSRLLVQESVADELLDRLKRRLATLRLGDPLDKNTDIGAINSATQLDKIRELSEVGEQEGAERWSPPCELPDRGWWFPPTLFTGVTQAHRIAREEIFGPVLSVLTFRTPAEALEKANNTPFGLSAGVWTDKGSRILWMAQRLRAGVVWANTFNRFDPTSPFGGYKESGYGREGGRHGLEGYLDV